MTDFTDLKLNIMLKKYKFEILVKQRIIQEYLLGQTDPWHSASSVSSVPHARESIVSPDKLS